jgi:HPr kinase/phosphorylase
VNQPETVHATCVAWDSAAVLITGKSGQGKSALGLQLMAYGCVLVADDRVQLSVQGDALVAQAPQTIAGLIEGRGVGILNASHLAQANVACVVDLDRVEDERLPQRRFITLLGCDVPLIYGLDSPLFAAVILQTLKAGWSDR